MAGICGIALRIAWDVNPFFIIRKCSMVVLLNVKLVPLNVRENKTIRECDKSAVTYDAGAAQCEDSTIKCEEKKKGTTECNKSTVTCDVGTIQCEDGTIKCEKKNKGTIECDKSIVTCNVGTA